MDVATSTRPTKYEGFHKLETVTVAQLNAYVLNFDPQVQSETKALTWILIIYMYNMP